MPLSPTRSRSAHSLQTKGPRAKAPQGQTVLVCGGRNFNDWPLLQHTLDKIQPATIIHGAARGADSLAGVYAKKKGIPCRAFPADWNKYGRSAGFRRNEEMLTKANPDLVVAFPGGNGTAHMVRTARERGYKVQQV